MPSVPAHHLPGALRLLRLLEERAVVIVHPSHYDAATALAVAGECDYNPTTNELRRAVAGEFLVPL